MSERGARPQPARTLRIIALFKFSKGMLLVLVGLGALHLLHPGIAAQAQRWLDALATTSDRRAVREVISWVSGLSTRGLEVLSIGALLYATLFAIEGVGLWLAKRWAEYLTAIVTVLFVPLEVVEIARHVNSGRLAALTLNLAVAAYLIYRLRHSRASRLAADGHGGVGSAQTKLLE